MPEVATPNQAEREFETGSDESFKNASATGGATHNENQRVTYANIKRTYDVYQDLDIQAARQLQVNQARINQIAEQALQNAVETANMVAKQAVKHADVASDALWNPIQQGTGDNITGRTVTDNQVASKAVDAAIAKSVDATVTPLVATLTEMLKVLSAMSAKISS